MMKAVIAIPLMMVLGFLSAPLCLAEESQPPGPRQVVVEGTSTLLETAREARDYFQEDPDRYYRQVAAFVDAVVDIERFTRGVMATYASSRRYRALETEEEKAAFRARVRRFGDILRDSLITTYAKALLNTEGIRIDTAPLSADSVDGGYASVEQTIYGEDDTAYRVQYSLRRTEDGWKLYNLTVEGINLGMVFRSQFASAVERHGGDVDAAIDQWRQEEHPVQINAGEKSQ